MSLNTKYTPRLFGLIILILANQAFGHGMSEAEKQAIIDGGNLGYLWIGATHMLTGYDHLLFIFGIIFFLTDFKDIVKYITAFTIGHSVTLILATFQGIQINYFLIDAVIALSVCYIAFTNLNGFKKLFKINPPNMLMMITVLGLIHGLGLSTRLQELPLNEGQLLLNILSFNAGIELGQIAALSIMLLIMTAVRKSTFMLTRFNSFSAMANTFLVVAGGLLFATQVQGYMESQLGSNETDELVTKSEAIPSLSQKNSKQPNWKDTIKVIVPANGGIEYKFQMIKGAKLEYEWKSSGPGLYYDFHGEPKGDTTGYFKSYKEKTEKQSSGLLISPFEGTHGWYWKNTTFQAVQVELKVKGEYTRRD